MICNQCVQEGKRSQVRYVETRSSSAYDLDCYYDEDGKQHWHDNRKTTIEYVCSNGHKIFKSDENWPCEVCGFEWKDKAQPIKGE